MARMIRWGRVTPPDRAVAVGYEAPVSVQASISQGVKDSLARSDHVHDIASGIITDDKMASGVGLSDGNIAKLPTATSGQVLKRGATVWSAASVSHTELISKEVGGVIDHADGSIPDVKLASGVGLSDGNICKLPTATEGQVLKRGATAWEAGTVAAAAWKKVAEVDITADTTTVTITGLDINTDKHYMMIIKLRNPAGIAVSYSLYVNGDTTSGNYKTQMLLVSGTSVTASSDAGAVIARGEAGENIGSAVHIFRDVEGYYRARSMTTSRDGTAVRIESWATCKTATVTNITQFDIVASYTNGIGSGSKIIIFGIAA